MLLGSFACSVQNIDDIDKDLTRFYGVFVKKQPYFKIIHEDTYCEEKRKYEHITTQEKLSNSKV